MKKFIKMSLVAATAVAGLTSTASAGNLTEMIKDSKLTGYVRYRLNSDHETANEGDMTEEAKAVAKITTPVNDMVTANVKTVSFAETKSAQTSANTAVTEANFVVKAGKNTVIAGLQTTQSPFFANNGDTRSHGVTALIPVGSVTVAAAYYTTTVGGGLAAASVTGDANTTSVFTNNVVALGALGKAGNVSYGAWYAQVQDSADVEDVTGTSINADAGDAATAPVGITGASAMSLEVKAKMGAMNLQVMKTEVSTDQTGDTGLTKAVLSGKAGKVSYAAAYAMTEKAGGMVALDKDSDAKSDLSMHNLNMAATTDASAIYLMGKYQVNDKVCASLKYLDGSSDVHQDFNEINVKAGYKMSKNFNVSAIYAMGEDTTATDFAQSRIEVKYSF